MSILETIKRVSDSANEAAVPSAYMFGVVSSVSPLTVRVDNRFDLTGSALVVMKGFRAGEYLTHRHSVDTGEGWTETQGETHVGLLEGDRVVLLRNQGGQQYLILGRI